ncbi:uncharacterized protein BJX67DRAFT_226090 [Aspergillus lucknowensis]|uniref:Uncharacterized protein n=1 Tax=Aspergillus lucknowensis TaxID=176173 RepID=A0ABR4LHZ9_9EURO
MEGRGPGEEREVSRWFDRYRSCDCVSESLAGRRKVFSASSEGLEPEDNTPTSMLLKGIHSQGPKTRKITVDSRKLFLRNATKLQLAR